MLSLKKLKISLITKTVAYVHYLHEKYPSHDTKVGYL